MDGLYFPAPRKLREDEKPCIADLSMDGKRFDENGDYVAFDCDLPAGHPGAHMHDSMAARVAWMTPEEAVAADTQREDDLNG